MEIWKFIVEYQWVISLALAIIAILQTWRIWAVSKKEKIKKRLVLYYRAIGDFNFNELPYDIHIDFQDTKLKRIKIIECVFGNKGNVPITRNEIIKPTIIEFDKPVNILSYNLIDKTDSELAINFEKKKLNGFESLQLVFNTIDVKNAIKFRLLLSSNEKDFSLRFGGKIKGEASKNQIRAEDVTHYDPDAGGGDGFSTIVLIVSAFFAAVYYSFIYSQKFLFEIIRNEMNFSVQSSEILSFLLGLLSPIAIIILVYLIVRKIIKRSKSKPPVKRSLTGLGPGFELEKKSNV